MKKFDLVSVSDLKEGDVYCKSVASLVTFTILTTSPYTARDNTNPYKTVKLKKDAKVIYLR